MIEMVSFVLFGYSSGNSLHMKQRILSLLGQAIVSMAVAVEISYCYQFAMTFSEFYESVFAPGLFPRINEDALFDIMIYCRQSSVCAYPPNISIVLVEVASS